MTSTATRVAAPERAGVPASPVAARWSPPSWRDRRLVLGLVLLLGSTVLGARLLGTDQPGTPVWVARHDLPVGTQVQESDLDVREVLLGPAAPRYVSATGALPQHVVIAHAVGRGELLPAGAVVTDSGSASRRTVTIPVERFHAAEDLGRGDRVDVYVTPDSAGSTADPVQLAAAAPIVEVEDPDAGFGGSGGTRGVVVAVESTAVGALVGGLGRGTVDLVRVPVEAP